MDKKSKGIEFELSFIKTKDATIAEILFLDKIFVVNNEWLDMSDNYKKIYGLEKRAGNEKSIYMSLNSLPTFLEENSATFDRGGNHLNI